MISKWPKLVEKKEKKVYMEEQRKQELNEGTRLTSVGKK